MHDHQSWDKLINIVTKVGISHFNMLGEEGRGKQGGAGSGGGVEVGGR